MRKKDLNTLSEEEFLEEEESERFDEEFNGDDDDNDDDDVEDVVESDLEEEMAEDSCWDEEGSEDDEDYDTFRHLDVKSLTETYKSTYDSSVACPRCQKSFVNAEGILRTAVVRRIIAGDTDFVKNHIERYVRLIDLL